MTRILLVGCGITSSISSYLLKKEFPHLELAIWDKAAGVGGRMSTRRSPQNSAVTLDLGAQYISSTPDYASIHKSYYDKLEKNKVLTPFLGLIEGLRDQENSKLYVAPSGSSSIVKDFLDMSRCQLSFNHQVNSITLENDKWKVDTTSGHSDSFDIVILTMPVPQILNLSGTLKNILGKNKSLTEGLNTVQYSSRYALGLFYPEGSKISLPNGVCAQYITADPIIRFVSIDNLKRGVDNTSPSVVVHTSVPFGKAHIDKTPDEVEPIVMHHFRKLFPSWPDPSAVKCQKWRFSQVTSAYPGLPGFIEIDKGLFAGGDAFTHSNLDGCIESAESIAKAVSQYVSS